MRVYTTTVITFVRVKVTMHEEITLCVYKSHSLVSKSHSYVTKSHSGCSHNVCGNYTLHKQIIFKRVVITLVSVIFTRIFSKLLLCMWKPHSACKITLYVWKSYSACKNQSCACWNHTRTCCSHNRASRNHIRECHNHTHTCQNHTLRVEITFVRV
jgi:hypothetical protein